MITDNEASSSQQHSSGLQSQGSDGVIQRDDLNQGERHSEANVLDSNVQENPHTGRLEQAVGDAELEDTFASSGQNGSSITTSGSSRRNRSNDVEVARRSNVEAIDEAQGTAVNENSTPPVQQHISRSDDSISGDSGLFYLVSINSEITLSR